MDFVVPEPHHVHAICFQILRSGFVFLGSVLAPIDLNHKATFFAKEVDDIRTNRMLPSELHTQLVIPQDAPNKALRVGPRDLVGWECGTAMTTLRLVAPTAGPTR